MRPHRIKTERLLIDKFVTDDTSFIVELVNDPEWIKYIGDKNIHQPEEARNYLLKGPIAMYKEVGYSLMRVDLKKDHTPIGMCGLIKRPNLSHPDLGFAFLRQWRNHGYAIEAARAILHYGWNVLKLDRVLAITHPDNKKSISLLEKINFSYQESLKLSSDGPEVSLFAIDHCPISEQ